MIVPAYNVERYVAECLDSVLAQRFADLEVVAVDDGSTDGTAGLLDEYAARDPRVRVVRRPNGGLGAARNTGAEHARGRYLAFVDADDVVPPWSFLRVVSTLEATGSDLAVGQIARWTVDDLRPMRWSERLHARTRQGIRLADEPTLLRDFYSTNKVFRTEFWKRHGFRFREVRIFEDQPLVTEALCRAAAIDVLPDVVYHWRQRDDASSLSDTMLTDRAKITARAEAIELTRVVVERLGTPDLVRAWRWTLLQFYFRYYLSEAPEETYDDVRALVTASWTPEQIAEDTDTTPDARVIAYLGLIEGRAAVEAFRAADGDDVDRFEVTEGSSAARSLLPRAGDPALPESLFRVADWQFGGWSRLIGFDSRRDDVFDVTLLAGIACTDPATASTALFAEHLPTGELVAFRNSGSTDPDTRPGEASYELDIAALGDRPGRWRLVAQVDDGSRRRWTAPTRSPGYLHPDRTVLVRGPVDVFRMRRDPSLGPVLDRFTPRVLLVGADRTPADAVRLRFACSADADVSWVEVVDATGGVHRLDVETEPGGFATTIDAALLHTDLSLNVAGSDAVRRAVLVAPATAVDARRRDIDLYASRRSFANLRAARTQEREVS